MPNAHCLLIIATDFFLVGGGLAVAWGKENLLSELAYQYDSMATTFSSAQSRMTRYLQELNSLLPSLKDDQQCDAFAITVVNAQRLLLTLGRESLDENANWLILHRSRPMEPVMPG